MTLVSSRLPSPDLAARVRKGSAEALAELYALHGPAVHQMAFRLTGNREDAEDVTHDVFVGLPEALAHYEERGALLAWMKRITVRVALMRLRANRRRREVDLDEAMGLSVAAQVMGEHAEVHTAVAALATHLRVVLVLKEIEGYSHKEIAELLGISAGASRVRLLRAIGLLRQQLGAFR